MYYLMLVTFCKLILTVSKGIIVIPGLGRKDRLYLVLSNLHLLSAYIQRDEWDCIVYIYASHETESAFWSLRKELDSLYAICDVVENKDKKVTENLFMVQPGLIKQSYDFVFVLFDDIRLVGDEYDMGFNKTFSLNYMMDIMKLNNLTLASPRVVGANKGGGQKFRNIMQAEPKIGTLGYVSVFVEMFVWMMTMPAYIAVWELLCPQVNPYGWGQDLWYYGYAKLKVRGHKMGIISSIVTWHEQKEGRTDNTGIEHKWNAVLAQERHYRKYLGIDLTKIRKDLPLANTSWNGAVTGYIWSH